MAEVAIYVRVSDDKLTDEGDRRQDINRQIDKLKSFCIGYRFGTPIIFSDDSISAYKDDYQSRPAFCKMLREIKAHRIDRVVIEDLTRWSRRLDDGLKTMKEVSESGCTVSSMAEGEIDVTTSNGWFRCAIGFMMSEWASKSMSDKVRSGMNRRLNNKDKVCESCGIVHLGRHPLTCSCKACLKRKKRVGQAFPQEK
jgi:DNA invertase Pin-like site-specific DNA recombinase